MTRVVPTTVRREHNNGISKFRVDTNRETENTTTLSSAIKGEAQLKAEAQCNIVM